MRNAETVSLQVALASAAIGKSDRAAPAAGPRVPIARHTALFALICVIATAITVSGAAAAVAPDTLSPALHRPMASVLSDAEEGDEVIVRGVVREKTGPSTYIIEDESGNAHVRVPDALLTGGIALAAGTPVEIHGRVKLTLTRGSRIEAQKATVLRASDVPFGAGDVRIR